MILYYLACWYIKVKEKVKLKETLIAIRNLKYTPKLCFGEYYFKGLLLCADTLMNKEKLKPALSLIEMCLKTNKTSLLAYEYMFVLMEK